MREFHKLGSFILCWDLIQTCSSKTMGQHIVFFFNCTVYAGLSLQLVWSFYLYISSQLSPVISGQLEICFPSIYMNTCTLFNISVSWVCKPLLGQLVLWALLLHPCYFLSISWICEPFTCLFYGHCIVIILLVPVHCFPLPCLLNCFVVTVRAQSCSWDGCFVAFFRPIPLNFIAMKLWYDVFYNWCIVRIILRQRDIAMYKK